MYILDDYYGVYKKNTFQKLLLVVFLYPLDNMLNTITNNAPTSDKVFAFSATKLYVNPAQNSRCSELWKQTSNPANSLLGRLCLSSSYIIQHVVGCLCLLVSKIWLISHMHIPRTGTNKYYEKRQAIQHYVDCIRQ